MKKLLLISLMSMSLFAADDEQNKPEPPEFVDVCSNGNYEEVQRLLAQGADPNKIFAYVTPLLNVCFRGKRKNSLKIALLLIKAGADLNYSNLLIGATPLIAAIYVNHIKMIRLLLSAGADINASNHNNNTPLMAASAKGNAAIVQLLLLHGANKDLTNKNNLNAEQIARENGHHELADFIQTYILPLRALALNMINQDPELREQLQKLPPMFSWYPEIEFEEDKTEENNQAAISSSSSSN